MEKFSLSLLTIAIWYLNICFAQNGRSPLCTQCICNGIKENSTVIDIDCTNKLITYNLMYDNKTWFDEKNVSYPLGKVIFKDSDIGDLRNQFHYSNLTHLDLSRNFIRNINDSYFAQLQNMKVLILSHNDLEHIQPDAFKGFRSDGENYPLRSLTSLKLDNNKLHTLNADLFEHIEQRLESLDLSYNPFKVLDQQTTIAIGGIIYLKELRLSFTDIKLLPDHFLHTPKHLKVLDLSGNNFVAIPEGLSESHGLEELHFDNNPIVNLTQKNGFPNISSLKILHMCEMLELEVIGKKALSGLENLEELHVCNNLRLHHIDANALTRIDAENQIWPPLKKLHLRDNRLTTLDFNLVLNWKNLKELDLRYNPWTCECENEWMVEELMPIYITINKTMAQEIRCEAPIEMEGKTFYEEYVGNKSMRCLDLYGNRPERDATVLVGVLVGLLIGIPLVLFAIYAYQKHWFGLFDNSPAAYSRQFYSRTRSDEL